MVNDELEEEIKEKQAYLKSSSYVEVQINVDDDSEQGIFTGSETGRTAFTPGKEKKIQISEVGIGTND